MDISHGTNWLWKNGYKVQGMDVSHDVTDWLSIKEHDVRGMDVASWFGAETIFSIVSSGVA